MVFAAVALSGPDEIYSWHRSIETAQIKSVNLRTLFDMKPLFYQNVFPMRTRSVGMLAIIIFAVYKPLPSRATHLTPTSFHEYFARGKIFPFPAFQLSFSNYVR